jgi:hypothetical protein
VVAVSKKGNVPVRRFDELTKQEQTRAIDARMLSLADLASNKNWPEALRTKIREYAGKHGDERADAVHDEMVAIAKAYFAEQAEADALAAWYPDALDLIIVLDPCQQCECIFESIEAQEKAHADDQSAT